MVLPSKNFTEKNSAKPPLDNLQPTLSISGPRAINQQFRSGSGGLSRSPTVSYATVTSVKSRQKSVPKNGKSLMTTDSIPLIFQKGTFTHSVFYFVPKNFLHLQSALHSSLRKRFPQDVGLGLSIKVRSQDTLIELALASADHCTDALATPIVLDSHVFTASPAHSSVNILHKIALTEIIPATRETLKNRLFSTFSRFGIVKDIVTYHDDMNGKRFTGNGHVYLEVPKESNDSFEPLTHRISLNGSDTSVLATWARMPDFCRYCKALGHSKDGCDKRPADSRACYICHQKGHISYQCTCSQDREPQPHKPPRNREPASTITSRRMATPIPSRGSKTPTKIDLSFGKTHLPPLPDTSSSAGTSSNVTINQSNTPNLKDDSLPTSVRDSSIRDSVHPEPCTTYATSPTPDSGLDSSIPTSDGSSASKYALQHDSPESLDRSTESTDVNMTDLQNIDFNKFPESPQEESQLPSSQSEMEA